MTYSTDKTTPVGLVTITSHRAFDVIQMNKRGEKPLSLLNDKEGIEEKRLSKDILEDNITRFDKVKRKKKNKKKIPLKSTPYGNGKSELSPDRHQTE